MKQLIFKFPFKTKYYEQDFYVSSSNFSAYKLIESWPNWPGRWLNIFGTSGSGKTHLSKILSKKIKKSKIINANEIGQDTVSNLKKIECLIIDNYKNNIEEKIFYSILDESKQLNKYIVINSNDSLKHFSFNLRDLKSRTNSFIFIGINLPTDELLKVIISKSFSEKQIDINPKTIDYILKNIERSYEKILRFLRDIDELSLSSGKSININLIKKVLNK